MVVLHSLFQAFYRLFVAAVVAGVAIHAASAANSRTDIVALSGNLAPDGGALSSFGQVALNDVGQVAFSATTDSSLFRYVLISDGSNLTTVAKNVQPVPDGNGEFSSFSNVNLNNAGVVAFQAFLAATAGGTNDDTGIYLHNGASFHRIMREGQPAPDGNGAFATATLADSTNVSGDVTFWGSLRDSSGGVADDSGLYRGNPSSLTQIVRENQPTPNGDGAISEFLSNPVLNDAGQVAFRAIVDSMGTSTWGIYRGDGVQLLEVARTSRSAPDGDGNFFTLGDPAINGIGQVAFRATVTGNSGGTSDNEVLYRSDGTATIEIARKGQAAPDGDGTFSFLSWNPRSGLNSNGQIVFSTALDGTSGVSDNLALIYGNGSTLKEVVRRGDPTPDGASTFFSFTDAVINESGQVAFTAGLNDGNGIFLGGEGFAEPVQVVRTGQEFLGSAISFVNVFPCGRGGCSNQLTLNINDTPQVAYHFYLQDGRSGIALWTLVPEPSSLAIVGIGGLLIGVLNGWPVRKPKR